MQLGKENHRRDIEDPHYGWLYLAHRDLETSRLHAGDPRGYKLRRLPTWTADRRQALALTLD
jgi:hypothetical protein